MELQLDIRQRSLKMFDKWLKEGQKRQRNMHSVPQGSPSPLPPMHITLSLCTTMTILFVDIWEIDIIFKGHFTCSIYYLLLIVTLTSTLPLPDHVICGWSLISNCQSISVRVRVLNDEQPDNNTSETRRVVATGVYVYIVYSLFWKFFAYFRLRIDVYFVT